MKQIFRVLQAVGLAAILLCLIHVPVFAQETDEANQFPKGVIEVPEGTTIEIDEEAGTVTIQNCPVEIESGDTFIVYLQDLPIGYVADEVSEQNDSVVISVQKAEKEVYELLDEEGDIALTPDMYEFVPAPNVTCSQSAESPISTQSLDYKDGTLSMNVGLGGASATVSVSNLHLYHSVSDGNIGVTLSGNWEIETTMSVSDDRLADIPLGEIRIAGVGKIGLNLSFEQSASVKCHLAGSFSTGVTIDQDGSGTASKGFNITNRSIEGKGEISASLKFTAGVDILVTSADLYAEVGAKTQYTAKTTYYKEPPRSVHCDDFKYYLFANVGVEAQYYSLLSGGMKPLASKKLLGTDAKDTPYIINHHFEDGQRVDRCSQGMEVRDLFFGGFDASFNGTVLTDKRDRVIETNFDLPWDMTVDQDLYLSHGNLNLNGRTLTVKGNLIQSGGTLTIENGTLNIYGDYRIQSVNDGKYGDSTGNLKMNYSQGTINIGGDFVVQTNSLLNEIGGGTINLDGNLYQKNAVGNKANFNSESYLNLVLTAGKSHIINFEESEKNSIGHLTLENNVTIQNNIHMGILDSNGHDMTVKGNMISSGDVDLDGGTLLVNGTMNHYRGTIRLNGGKLNITGNYLCVGADSNFTPEKENITWCEAYLKMTYAADEMRVGGNFLINSRLNYNELTAGTLYIGGDFTQLNSYGVAAEYNFSPDEKHKTVLNGTGTQTISFESGYSYFGTLETTNDQLAFEKRVSWLKQGSDIHAVSNGCELGNNDMDLNGYQLTMDGDISVYSNIDVNNGTLKVNGSLNHYKRTINLNGGKLDITGNYLCVGEDSNFTPGKENITWSEAYLKMTYAADEMRVGGNFLINSNQNNYELTAGTLYIGGDFTQLNSYGVAAEYNFSPDEKHKTVLNGTGTQTISFESGYSYFGTLEATNNQLVFEKNVSWIKQGSDIHAESKGINFANKSMDLNGSQLTIDGDIDVSNNININNGTMKVNGSLNHKRQIINLNGGKLQISGDYHGNSNAYLKMLYAGDEMRVGGNFLVESWGSDNEFSAGTLYVGGDFKQITNEIISSSAYNFMPKVEHKTILNGSGKQIISFDSSYCSFGTLEATNDQLVFEKNVSWMKQGSDIHAESNESTLTNKDIDLNGYQLTIEGDIHVRSNIDIDNGTIKVEGSLNQSNGTINLNGGKLQISENYNGGGYLKMVYAADEMRVGGNFLENSFSNDSELLAGTLYIGGDFTQSNSSASSVTNNFAADVNHKTVLNGAGKQTISFASSSCHFGTLELTKPNSWYTFNPDQCWINLIECAGPTQIASGYSGDLTWNLNDWGVLTFRGNGVMKNYTSKTAMPWYKYADQITSVVIESGVTRIGDYAFYGIPMTSIEIPDTVTAIGDYAFKSAAALKEVALPNKLTKLGESAFYGCTSLESIDIPASLYTVKPYTFKNCTALSSVTFHEGNLMKLSDGAFYGTALTEVTFPACLNIIDSYCFKNCDKLASIVIPEGKLIEIREAVFYGTAASEITIPEGIKKVGAYAFKNCVNLTIINLPDSLTSVGEASFYACTGLQNITIPDHVTSIGNYAFRKCTGLTEAIFGNELTEIGESAFYGCSGLTNLNLNNVTTLGGYAFKSCTGLTSVDLGKVETIGESAFHSCTGLENITFPASVTSIGDYCFSGSTKLSQMQFEGDAPKIGVNAFRGLTVKVVYPADNESWTSDVMQNYGGSITWTALETETSDADTEETVSEAPIEDTDIEKDNTDTENPAAEAPDAEPTEGTCGEGLSWKQNGNELTISGNGKLDNCIWENGSEIQKVIIEENVTFIGDHAFDGLDALTEIIFKGNAPVISINAFAARDLTLKYPCGVTSWTSDIFQNYGGNVIWCEVDENGSLVEQQDDGDTVSEKAVSEQSIFEENVTEETISESVEATE